MTRTARPGKYVWCAAVLCLLVLAFVGGCRRPGNQVTPPGNSGNPPGQTTLTNVTWRSAYLLHPCKAGILWAVEKGVFEEHGLKVTPKSGGMQADPIRLVASGSDDFGEAGSDALLLARAQGVPVVAIAAEYLQDPTVFLCKPDIKKPEQFVGRKVAVLAGNTTETIYHAVMNKLGIDRSKVKEGPAGFDPKPFIAGNVDVWTAGWVNNEPYTLDKQGVKYNLIQPREYGISFMGYCYFTTEKVIREKPQMVQAFVDAVVEGWEQSAANEDAAVTALTKYLDKADADSPRFVKWVYKTQATYVRPEGRRFCEYSAQDWQNTYDILRGQKVLTKDVTLDQAYTLQFIKAHYAKAQGK